MTLHLLFLSIISYTGCFYHIELYNYCIRNDINYSLVITNNIIHVEDNTTNILISSNSTGDLQLEIVTMNLPIMIQSVLNINISVIIPLKKHDIDSLEISNDKNVKILYSGDMFFTNDFIVPKKSEKIILNTAHIYINSQIYLNGTQFIITNNIFNYSFLCNFETQLFIFSDDIEIYGMELNTLDFLYVSSYSHCTLVNLSKCTGMQLCENSALSIFGNTSFSYIIFTIEANGNTTKHPKLNLNNYAVQIVFFTVLLSKTKIDFFENDIIPLFLYPCSVIDNAQELVILKPNAAVFLENISKLIEYDVSISEGLFYFHLKENMIYNPTLPDFCKVEISGTTFWSASTKYTASMCFSINHLALSEQIDFSNLNFNDFTSRQIININTDQITINCTCLNVSKLSGNFKLIGIDSQVKVESGTVEIEGSCERNQIYVFPRATAKINDNMVATSAISFFNPTGAGRFIFPTNYEPGVIAIHSNEYELDILPKELNFEVVSTENGDVSTIILVDKQVYYKDEVYKVVLSGNIIKMRLSTAVVDNLCVTKNSTQCPKGTYSTDSIDGFTGMSVVYASDELNVNLDLISVVFTIHAIGTLDLYTLGRGEGMTMKLSGVVNYVSGNVGKIIVEPLSNVFSLQSTFDRVQVNYDGRDRTQILFNEIPSVSNGIFLKIRKNPGEQGNMITVAVKGNYSEEELEYLSDSIRSDKEYCQFGEISGFRGIDNSLSWATILGIVIGCIVIVTGIIGTIICVFIKRKRIDIPSL